MNVIVHRSSPNNQKTEKFDGISNIKVTDTGALLLLRQIGANPTVVGAFSAGAWDRVLEINQ